jgi:hypothetical protein
VSLVDLDVDDLPQHAAHLDQVRGICHELVHVLVRGEDLA